MDKESFSELFSDRDESIFIIDLFFLFLKKHAESMMSGFWSDFKPYKLDNDLTFSKN